MIILLLVLLFTGAAVWANEPSTACSMDNHAASNECRRQAELEHLEWVLGSEELHSNTLGPYVFGE